MNTNEFFIEISKPIEGEDSSLLIEKLFKLAQRINTMSPDDLIAFFQALSMLKKTQPRNIFKKNPLRRSIADTQLIVINAMRNNMAHAKRFNNVIENEWVHYTQYVI